MACLGQGEWLSVVGNKAWQQYIKGNLEDQFPKLKGEGYKLTSPDTSVYNCVAWAVELEQEEWWWPDAMGQDFWPPEAPREENIGAFLVAFSLFRYEVCENPGYEEGFDKIAIYVDPSNDKPTHVARIKRDCCTSKIGNLEDIDHSTLEGLAGSYPAYGRVHCFMKRVSQN